MTTSDHVVGALTPHTASVIREVLRSPPADQHYDHLKEALTKHTTEIEHRLQQLLRLEEVGDRKAICLLRRIQTVAPDAATTPNNALREIFLQRLPTQVRMILTPSLACTLETLAQLAIKLCMPAFLP